MDLREMKERLTPAVPGRRTRWIVAVVIALVYVVGIVPRWWPTPDSALYLGLARSLAGGEGYVFNGSPSATVTPGFPLILAGVRLVFGPSFYAANAFVVLCALGTLFLVWVLTRRLAGDFAALVVVIATALSYPFYHTGHKILTDAPFALCGWVVLLGSLRLCQTGRWRWLAVAATGAATGALIRAPGVIFLGALAAGLVLNREGALRWRARILSAGVIVVSAGAVLASLYLAVQYYGTSSETPLYVARSSRQLGNLAILVRCLVSGFVEFPRVASRLYSGQEFAPLGIAVGALWLWGAWLETRSGRTLLPAATVLSVVILAGLGGVRGRYLLQSWPAMALLVAVGAGDLVERVTRLRDRTPSARRLAVWTGVVLLFGAAINTPRTLRNALYYSSQAYTGNYYRVIRDGEHRFLFRAAEAIERAWTPGTTVLCSSDDVSMLHYLTGKTMIPLTPSNSKASSTDAERYIEKLNQQNGRVLVVLDIGDAGRGFADAWTGHVSAHPSLQVADQTGQYTIYLRP